MSNNYLYDTEFEVFGLRFRLLPNNDFKELKLLNICLVKEDLEKYHALLLEQKLTTEELLTKVVIAIQEACTILKLKAELRHYKN